MIALILFFLKILYKKPTKLKSKCGKTYYYLHIWWCKFLNSFLSYDNLIILFWLLRSVFVHICTSIISSRCFYINLATHLGHKMPCILMSFLQPMHTFVHEKFFYRCAHRFAIFHHILPDIGSWFVLAHFFFSVVCICAPILWN